MVVPMAMHRRQVLDLAARAALGVMGQMEMFVLVDRLIVAVHLKTGECHVGASSSSLRAAEVQHSRKTIAGWEPEPHHPGASSGPAPPPYGTPKWQLHSNHDVRIRCVPDGLIGECHMVRLSQRSCHWGHLAPCRSAATPRAEWPHREGSKWPCRRRWRAA